DCGACFRVAQHTLRREYNQRFAPRSESLSPQHVEILRRRRRLTNLNIVFRCELEVALNTRAGMLRPLALITVWEQHDNAGGQIPLVIASADELIDDDLCAVGEIAELRFPHDERFGIVAAESVFEAKASGFGERRIVDFAKCLLPGKMGKGDPVVFGIRIDSQGVTLVEGPTLRVLSGKAHWRASENQRGQSYRLAEAVIDRPLAMAHLGSLFEELDELRMHMKILGHANQAVRKLGQLFKGKPRVDFAGRIVLAVPVV